MKALKTLAALATIALAACTQQSAQEQPPLTGPSGPATSIRVTATPDTIAQDGSAVSTIAVSLRPSCASVRACQPIRVSRFIIRI